ncbi:hypothetical protein SEA_EVANESCE_56 [Mycobacterium phage Evanesce]|uniref:Uncharacterized protein n=14 Tax=Caudoviricetes TaxID=2731619 RepID=A0A385D1B1_9CAUD|nr:hypothetical protein Giles_54 [Mycobacterium phage Giles]AHY84241.1 hypothetical protein PBI_HH92_56 [Mycobacterium phage HH92]AKQ07832.1 hypothetical protein SEA_KINBOTE_56 [Mycobacterium phage Kinbote]ALF00277.1 hypothetical protein SEA_EVANESCE_56 [Mycobacterium phage Evanesce]ATN90433.1 hypothetical protein SEA_LILHAZELNUT_57 [Mycobacterium phage LilHazelnut]AXQ51488.1 hypothetical protein SEA_AMOCHICK_57 [Mycobacterium phage Amochick]QBQ71257.1 hypothetical protein SEA_DAEGAL_59 [Myco
MIAPKISMDDRTRETVDRFADALLSVAAAVERAAAAVEASNAGARG